jgi:hypothetical protein
MANIKRLLKADQVFKKYRRMVNSMPLAAMMAYEEEINKLHAGRKSRLISRRTPSKKLIDGLGQDQAYRSRLVEILLHINKVYGTLQELQEMTKDYILITYKEHYSSFRSKGDREAAVKMVLAKSNRLLNKLDTLETLCNLVIGDIDKAYWVFKAALDAKAPMTTKDRTL